jgi:hypothetical protein
MGSAFSKKSIWPCSDGPGKRLNLPVLTFSWKHRQTLLGGRWTTSPSIVWPITDVECLLARSCEAGS